MFWISDLDNPQYASLIPQPKKRIINKKRTLGIDNKQHEHLRVVVPSGLKPQYGVYPLTPALRLGVVFYYQSLPGKIFIPHRKQFPFQKKVLTLHCIYGVYSLTFLW